MSVVAKGVSQETGEFEDTGVRVPELETKDVDAVLSQS
jgi:hypothetical protein